MFDVYADPFALCRVSIRYCFVFFAVFSECLDSCWPNRADSGSRDKPDDPSCSAV